MTLIVAAIMVTKIAAHAVAFTSAGHMLSRLVKLAGVVLPPAGLYYHPMQPVNDLRFISTEKMKRIPSLTKAKIRLLETADCLNYKEKVRLLAMLSRKRWLTEVDVRRDRRLNSEEIISLLRRVGLAWSSQFYKKKDGTKVYWIEVGLNQAVIDYLKKNRTRLSIIEAGILYGYPATSALACTGIIEDHMKLTSKKTAAESCLAGIFSSDFTDAESRYFEQQWRELRQISPTIIKFAEENHRNTAKR